MIGYLPEIVNIPEQIATNTHIDIGVNGNLLYLIKREGFVEIRGWSEEDYIINHNDEENIKTIAPAYFTTDNDSCDVEIAIDCSETDALSHIMIVSNAMDRIIKKQV